MDGPPSNYVSVDATTNRITGAPYAYDANGNMTNDGNNALVYAAENRVLSATNGGSSGTYSYDGSNLRVQKVSSGTTTVYIFSGSKVIAEYVNGTAPTAPTREYVYSGGALLAKIESGATTYYHQDHLSNRTITDSGGNAIAQLGHYPFGESWYNTSNDKLLFTTYERDAESGNDYALARSNVNRLARFSSLDPVSGSPADPQSLDQYSYVEYDPVNMVDPAGLQPYFQAPVPPVDWNFFLIDLFLNFSSNEPGTGRWRDGVWISNSDIGQAIGNLVFGGGPTFDPNPGNLTGAPPQPSDPCQRQRSKSLGTFNFVLNNFDDASIISALLGTTTANILGLSSVESGNGASNLSQKYNNYFGLTYPFPGSGTAYNSPNGNSYSTYPSPGFWNSAVSFMRSRQGGKVAGSVTPQGFAGALTSAPMAFNSEPGRFQIYVNRISLVQADINCLFGSGN